MCGVGRERRPKPKIARRMPPMTETPKIKIAMIKMNINPKICMGY